jgi:HD-GYP domain-containing protein (c-di-GMP phosphodiesterase class II)
LGALLHDIGKVAIPRNILLKPSTLTEDEVTIMRLHPEVGRDLLAEFDGLDAEAAIVYAHHERFDGTGYPRRLTGKEIPKGARIFSIVDTFDAITSDRPYRNALSTAKARDAINEGRGTQFDPQIVDRFGEIEDPVLLRVRELLPEGVTAGKGVPFSPADAAKTKMVRITLQAGESVTRNAVELLTR